MPVAALPAEAVPFDKAWFLGLDYDGTAAQTHMPAPNGLTVETAYEQAVSDTFGARALSQYIREGRLGNRAPAEITSQLVPDASVQENYELTEQLVGAKLGYLADQVGSRLPSGNIWPEVCDGFAAFWQTAHTSRLIRRTFTTGFISSGHEPFIRKFLEVHDLPPADFIVSDDDMRRRMRIVSQERCVKPGQIPLALAHKRWLERYGLTALDNYEQVKASKRRMTYAGDGLAKDGGLAERAQIGFFHTPPGNPGRWNGLLHFVTERAIHAQT